MNKEEVLKLIENNVDSYPQIIKAYHKEFYKMVFEKYEGIKFSEKLYQFVHEGENIGKMSFFAFF
jgi:hypothetical protein